MVINEAALRTAITNALLRSAGLPTLDDIEKMLSKSEKSTTVTIVVDNSRYGKAGVNLLEKLVGKYEFIEVKVSEKSSWPSDLPPPLIVVGGGLSGRLLFYGAPTDILSPMFMLAVAASCGAWRPSSCSGLEGARGRARLYVVPGLPCARAMYNSLHVLFCSRAAELEVVNVEGYYAMGKEIPVKQVPTFVSPSGKKHTATPRSPAEVLSWWSS